MYGNRDIVAKGMVVQSIDAEEQHNVDQPALQRHFVGSDEERRSRLVELGDVAGDCDKQKLDKGQEGATGGFDSVPYAQKRVSVTYSLGGCARQSRLEKGGGRTKLTG